MKKLRKLRLNDAQQLKTSELEMINAGRLSVVISDSCHCSYGGDSHEKTCLSGDGSVATLLTAASLIREGLVIGSGFGPYVTAIGTIVGLYGSLEVINPSIDTYKMTFTGKCYNGNMIHYSTFVGSRYLF